MMQPAEGIYERLGAREGGELFHASFTPGFSGGGHPPLRAVNLHIRLE